MNYRSSFILIWCLLALYSCIDRFEGTNVKGQGEELMVEGLITDEPGPYTVKLSNRLFNLGAGIGETKVRNAKIVLHSDKGESETLTEVLPGVYQTRANGIRGTIGNKYWINAETSDGKVFESIPDQMFPAGEVDSVYCEFVTIINQNGSKSYGYRVFIDSRGPKGENKYVRWRFNGVYAVKTFPELHKLNGGGSPFCTQLDPRPCSGYVVGIGSDGNQKIIKVANCTCCECWANQFEDKPKVSDGSLAFEGRYAKVYVGFVPVNYYTFQDKYRATVSQMGLSKEAYDFWYRIQTGKEGATSLFQPSYFKIISNLQGGPNVIGLFYAASVRRKSVFIKKEENNAYLLAEVPRDCNGRDGPAPESCLTEFPGSTNQKPTDWN